MEYLSLYRKYRPRLFKEILGQDHIVRTLQNQVKKQKITHAYLLNGPRGIGKTSTARILSYAINCLNSGNGEPCLTCDACKHISTGTATDIIEIDGATNNGVAEIRLLREKALLVTYFLKRKIYIIDEVHMLSAAAFNALLKILEEPPRHVVFILATTEIHKLPLTIISRCQRFDFYSLIHNQMENYVEQIFSNEDQETEQRAIKTISLLSGGSVRDALGIIEQCISYSENVVTNNDVREIYGVLATDDIVEFLNKINRQDILGCKRLLDSFFQKGTNIPYFLMNILNFLKEKILRNLSDDQDYLDYYQPMFLDKLKMGNQTIVYLIEEFRKLALSLISAANEYNFLEIMIIKIISHLKIIDSSDTNKTLHEQTQNSKQSDHLENNSIHSNGKTLEIPLTIEAKNVPQINVIEKKSTEEYYSKIVYKKLESSNYNAVDVTNLLLSVELKYRRDDEYRWEHISEFLDSKQYRSVAGILQYGKIAASGEKFIVLVTKNVVNSKEINELILDEKMIKFIKTILDRPVLVIAVNIGDWKLIKKIYLEKQKHNTLTSINVEKINAKFFLDFERICNIETTRHFNEATATNLEKFLNEEFKDEYEVK